MLAAEMFESHLYPWLSGSKQTGNDLLKLLDGTAYVKMSEEQFD
jgi:hypothetical protein